MKSDHVKDAKRLTEAQKIQTDGKSIRYNGRREPLLEKVLRFWIGRYLGVSAIYFCRPTRRPNEPDALFSRGGQAIQKPRANPRSSLQRAYFKAAETISLVITNNRW